MTDPILTRVTLTGEEVTYPYETEDWAKGTLDWQSTNADDLRREIQACGFSVATFKTLPAYRFALASGRYPWLADL